MSKPRRGVLAEAMQVNNERRRVVRLFAGLAMYVYGQTGWRKPSETAAAAHDFCRRPGGDGHRVDTLALGGWRARKTVWACNELRRFAITYPGVPIHVFKHTLAECKDSTVKTLLGDGSEAPIIEPALIDPHSNRMGNNIRPHFYLRNGASFHFFGLLDRGKRGGSKCGAALIDDVYNPKRRTGQTSLDDFNYVIGRISAKGPEQLFLLTSNPPNKKDHWLLKEFPEESSEFRARFKFRTSDNRENLQPGYEESLREQLGEWGAKRYLDGEVVFEQEGPGVFSRHYQDQRHTIPGLEPHIDIPIYCSWDYQITPAVSVHQFCPNRPPAYWRMLYESLASELMDIDIFAQMVIAEIRDLFPRHAHNIRHCGDHAGNQRHGIAYSNAEGKRIRSYVGVLNDMGIYPDSIPNRSKEEGINLQKKWLNLHNGIGIHPRCEIIREGYAGGYQRKVDLHGSVLIETIADNYYAHLMDTCRYFGDNVVDVGGIVGHSDLVEELVNIEARYYDRGARAAGEPLEEIGDVADVEIASYFRSMP